MSHSFARAQQHFAEDAAAALHALGRHAEAAEAAAWASKMRRAADEGEALERVRQAREIAAAALMG